MYVCVIPGWFLLSAGARVTVEMEGAEGRREVGQRWGTVGLMRLSLLVAFINVYVVLGERVLL